MIRLFEGAVFFLLTFFALSCASERPRYLGQIQILFDELSMTFPEKLEDVFDFATVRSHRLDLTLPGLREDLIGLLGNTDFESSDNTHVWYEKMLLAYLLALVHDADGFATLIDLIEDEDLSPDVLEGFQYCGMKFLGITERDKPPVTTDWEVDLKEWKDALGRIRKVGIHSWHREHIENIVLSGTPSSGDEALAASSWLPFNLKVSDVPFLSDLLEQGSPKSDVALLSMIEKLLMRKFSPEFGEDILDQGLEAFWLWYNENAMDAPDQWITKAFVEAGYNIEDLYSQNSITRIINGLLDDSENWVLIRSHTLAALNRICGFNTDRSIIFMSQETREDAIQSYLSWYKELAGRVKLE